MVKEWKRKTYDIDRKLSFESEYLKGKRNRKDKNLIRNSILKKINILFR